MSAWITVYCKAGLEHVTRADLLAVLDFEDPYMTAEAYGIEDDAIVDAGLDNVYLEPVDGQVVRSLALRYESSKRRPILIERITIPAKVREYVAEELDEWLKAVVGSGADLVRAHLTHIAEIVTFELGFGQLEDMGMVFAMEIARELARAGDGLVKDYDGVWWAVNGRIWTRLFPEESPAASHVDAGAPP